VEIKCRACGATPDESEDIYQYGVDIWQHRHAYQCIDFLKLEISRLQSEARWIPVSERLPDENKLILLHDRVSGEPVFAYLASGLHGLHWTIDSKNYSVHGYSNQYTLWKYVTPPMEGS
jgi:hypothetical protein